METIPLALFGDRKKAEPVQQRLVQAGFNASINDRPRLTCLWFESHDTAGVRVEVPSDQFANAEQFLHAFARGLAVTGFERTADQGIYLLEPCQ